MFLCMLLVDIEIFEGNIDGMLSIEFLEIFDFVVVEIVFSFLNFLFVFDK